MDLGLDTQQVLGHIDSQAMALAVLCPVHIVPVDEIAEWFPRGGTEASPLCLEPHEAILIGLVAEDLFNFPLVDFLPKFFFGLPPEMEGNWGIRVLILHEWLEL